MDWAEADTHCWRCGCQRHLQRCHIIPDSLGGEDKPSNIVLLCSRCHSEGPNVTDPEIMWDWIKAYKVPFYETFWSLLGQRGYEFIYKKSIIAEIKDIMYSANVTDEEIILQKYKEISQETFQKASIHYGQPYFNTATVAEIYRIILKQMAKEFNVELKLSEKHGGLFNLSI